MLRHCNTVKFERMYNQSGFTIIEMLVALFVSSVLLMGLYANFWTTSRVNTTQLQYTERLQDLRIVAQIMANELRLSSQAALNTGILNKIVYEDVDGNEGHFLYKPATTPPSLCWDRPIIGGGCQELIRDLDPAVGMQANVAVDLVTGAKTLNVTLTASYLGIDHQTRTVPLQFRVWPRNP